MMSRGSAGTSSSQMRYSRPKAHTSRGIVLTRESAFREAVRLLNHLPWARAPCEALPFRISLQLLRQVAPDLLQVFFPVRRELMRNAAADQRFQLKPAILLDLARLADRAEWFEDPLELGDLPRRGRRLQRLGFAKRALTSTSPQPPTRLSHGSFLWRGRL